MGVFANLKSALSLKTQIAEREQKLRELEHDIGNREEIRREIIADATKEASTQLEAITLELTDKEALKQKITAEALAAVESERLSLAQEITDLSGKLADLRVEFSNQSESYQALTEKSASEEKKLVRLNAKIKNRTAQFKSIQQFVDAYGTDENIKADINLILADLAQLEVSDLLEPTTELELRSMEIPDLRKQMREIQKQIDETLERYKSRYTTKANLALYSLMVVALRAELQNVLYAMRYDKLDKSLKNIKTITQKYLSVAANANQQIAPTMVKFIDEIEILFSECVKVEYEYYVRKERIKEEQRALRAQMKQEAEERKALEAQQKQVEKEESKYNAELEKIKAQLADADAEKAKQYEERIAELQSQLAQVAEKKEEISRLQHGKAGYVYIISNLGAFGDRVFKIGMTRRLEPQERVDELGDASVPFPFDVHSFIFSDDAVGLESTLHKTLHERRQNKVNLRKEFFTISVDELEALVNELDPTAQFTKTMLAEQFRQSQSMAYVLNDEEESDVDLDDDDVA